MWDPEAGECKHTLQARTGAVTCFQRDEFKVLSGSDGTHISWDMRDGPFICDLLTASIVSGKWSLKADGALQQVIVQKPLCSMSETSLGRSTTTSGLASHLKAF